jgi:hypothetical protein
MLEGSVGCKFLEHRFTLLKCIPFSFYGLKKLLFLLSCVQNKIQIPEHRIKNK